MSSRNRKGVALWCLISVFLIVWLGVDLLNAIDKGLITDLRTSNAIYFDKHPVWFSVVFFIKLLAISAAIYFVVSRDMSKFNKALTRISIAIQKLVGSNRLKPYEDACLTAWVGAISSESGGALEKQLNSFDYIERGPQGMVSAFHSLSDPDYKTWERFLFKRKDSSLKVFEGILFSSIGDLACESRFSIYIHQGRLSTIEFKSPPKQLMRCEGEIQVKKTRCLVQL